MDNTTVLLAGTSFGIAVGTIVYFCKHKDVFKKSLINGTSKKRSPKGFPDTTIGEEDSIYMKYADDECKGNDDRLLEMFESIMQKMKFKEVNIEKISKREKVFEFKLKYGDTIRILSSINNGKNKNKNGKLFSRKTFKVGLVDKLGEYVVSDFFPKLGVVDHSKGTMGAAIDKLMERIADICEEMQDEYQRLDEE